jgi:hypothetical protein
MMKYIIALLFIFTAVDLAAQTTVTVQWLPRKAPANSDTIYYTSNRKLTWPDFKGIPEEKSVALAITSSGFGFLAGVQKVNGKTTINITVYCYFGKNSSWVKTGRESDYALNHEQHHFDITYLVTCMFMQKLKAAAFTWGNYNSLLNKLYAETSRQLEKMQNEYDGQTKNGQLKDVQAEWNKKIESQLSSITTN